MQYLKEVIHQYNPGDVVYIVNDYKVNKAIVEKVIIEVNKEGRLISYSCYDYRLKDTDKRKTVSIKEAMIVDNLLTAKASARINWERIIKAVTEQLDNMTDKAFEPIEEKKENESTN